MEKLNKDELHLIGLNLDSETLLNFCLSNRKFNEKVCKDENFWQNKLKKDYPLLEELKKEGTWKSHYLNMIYYISKINENYQVPYIPTKGYDPKEIYTIFNKYIYDNHAYNVALIYAARGGHKDIIDILIKKGADDFDGAMEAAAKFGKLDIVELMIEKGADDLDHALLYAANGGQEDIVKFLIERGATDISSALYYAVKEKQINIIKILLKEKNISLVESFWLAAKNGYIEAIQLFLDELNILKGLLKKREIKVIQKQLIFFQNCNNNIFKF